MEEEGRKIFLEFGMWMFGTESIEEFERRHGKE
jgi:hypothetical protein